MNLNKTAMIATGIGAIAGMTFGAVVAVEIGGEASGETPSECITALDAAEDTIDLAAQGMDIAGDAIDAAYRWDAAGLDRATAPLVGMTDEVYELNEVYAPAAEACRGE